MIRPRTDDREEHGEHGYHADAGQVDGQAVAVRIQEIGIELGHTGRQVV